MALGSNISLVSVSVGVLPEYAIHGGMGPSATTSKSLYFAGLHSEGREESLTIRKIVMLSDSQVVLLALKGY